MAEGKKFKPIKAVGRVRTDDNREERLQEGVDSHLKKIAGMYSDRGKPLDLDKVKQYMALFAYAKQNWGTGTEAQAALDKEKTAHGMNETPITDAMIEGIDVQALIQELKHKAARGLEKVPEGPANPEEEAAFDAIMKDQPPTAADETLSPELAELLRKLLGLKDGQKPGETELG
jgi:hypothetical protein